MRLSLCALFVAFAVLASTGYGQNQESNIRCCIGDENRPFALACPPGTNVSAIDTAFWGNPSGYCGAFQSGLCNTPVQEFLSVCLGKSFCEVTLSDEVFRTQPCPAVEKKRLAVQWQCGGTVVREQVALPATPPLSTRGRFIVDRTNQRIKLAAVNWYGGQCEELVPDGLHVNHVRDIARTIRQAGFNAVRLQWANELVERNPVVETQFVAANPQLFGLRALDIYTAVVEALGLEGLFVILDNHMSDGGWCCTPFDSNGLWYNAKYPEETFFQHWEFMVARYKDHANVIGAELRNELRFSCGNVDENGERVCRYPSWDGPEATNWKRASTTVGNRIHQQNPDLLVLISGMASSSRLRFVRDDPTALIVPNKLVYVAHDYPWWHPESVSSYDEFKQDVENNWGFVVQENQNWTSPLFVSEFGTCHEEMSCIQDTENGPRNAPVGLPGGRWFEYLSRYLQEIDADFATWAWNGSTCQGPTNDRVFGTEERYGIAQICWNGIAFQPYLDQLQRLQKPQFSK